MFRSPVKTRNKAKAIKSDKRRPEDKPVLDSPLSSVDLAPTADKTEADMEAAVNKSVAEHLSKDNVFDKLTERLVGRIEKIVEDVVARSLKAYMDEVTALREQVSRLEERLTRAEETKIRQDDLEQYQRRNNIRVFGVPETPNEDTDKLVVQLFREKLDVEVSVDRLDRSHRIGRRPTPNSDGTSRHRPIIVRFATYRDRKSVFSAKKKLKGSGITIREDLTSARQELLRRATEMFGRNKVWTLDGRVMWLDGEGHRGAATRVADLPEK